MRKVENFDQIILLVMLMAIGQMAYSICIPLMEDIANTLVVKIGYVQLIIASYLTTFGISQFIYGPWSDKVGRKPMITLGMAIFTVGSLACAISNNLPILVLGSALQGLGIGVSGVMLRTIPRDLYSGSNLIYVNSIMGVGLVLTPLITPFLGTFLAHQFPSLGWRASYLFLSALCIVIGSLIMKFMRETRNPDLERPTIFAAASKLLSSKTFICYLLMLICAQSGLTVFEASVSILMPSILNVNKLMVSVYFIVPVPAALLGSWYASRPGKQFNNLMWTGTACCLLASILMITPAFLGIIKVWSLLIPGIIFFFGAGILIPVGTSAAMEPFGTIAGLAGAFLGGFQNLGSGISTFLSAFAPQKSQMSLGVLMSGISIIILLSWLAVRKHSVFKEH